MRTLGLLLIAACVGSGCECQNELDTLPGRYELVLGEPDRPGRCAYTADNFVTGASLFADVTLPPGSSNTAFIRLDMGSYSAGFGAADDTWVIDGAAMNACGTLISGSSQFFRLVDQDPCLLDTYSGISNVMTERDSFSGLIDRVIQGVQAIQPITCSDVQVPLEYKASADANLSCNRAFYFVATRVGPIQAR